MIYDSDRVSFLSPSPPSPFCLIILRDQIFSYYQVSGSDDDDEHFRHHVSPFASRPDYAPTIDHTVRIPAISLSLSLFFCLVYIFSGRCITAGVCRGLSLRPRGERKEKDSASSASFSLCLYKRAVIFRDQRDIVSRFILEPLQCAQLVVCCPSRDSSLLNDFCFP